MLSWEEIRAYIRKHYRPISETETSLTLQCVFPDGARQSVLVTHITHRTGGPFIEVASAVGDTRSLAAADALAYNDRVSTGTLVLVGELICLRHLLAVQELRLGAVDHALSYVASEASRLRRFSRRPPVPPELFMYLAS